MILKFITLLLLPIKLFLKYSWRFFDYETYPHMFMESEDYEKVYDDYEKKLKKERDEKESKIFTNKVMEK